MRGVFLITNRHTVLIMGTKYTIIIYLIISNLSHVLFIRPLHLTVMEDKKTYD
jgi:di/tricarboxylate transporter